MHAFGLPLTREGDPAGDLHDREVMSGAGLGPAWNRAGPPWRGRPIIKRQVMFGRSCVDSHERRQPSGLDPPPGHARARCLYPSKTVTRSEESGTGARWGPAEFELVLGPSSLSPSRAVRSHKGL